MRRAKWLGSKGLFVYNFLCKHNQKQSMNQKIVSEAFKILSSQGSVPLSPGVRTASGIDLCLGAALVDAANVVRGVTADERDSARMRMVANFSPDSILKEAAAANLSMQMCQDAIVHNDSLKDDSRKAGVMEWLQAVRAA